MNDCKSRADVFVYAKVSESIVESWKSKGGKTRIENKKKRDPVEHPIPNANTITK